MSPHVRRAEVDRLGLLPRDPHEQRGRERGSDARQRVQARLARGRSGGVRGLLDVLEALADADLAGGDEHPRQRERVGLLVSFVRVLMAIDARISWIGAPLAR